MSTGNEQPTDVRDSTPGSNSPDGAEGGMGVSSERVGHAGPGQERTDGVNDASTVPTPADAPPEQGEGGPEDNPQGLAPKAGYPSADPRSKEKPFQPGTGAGR